MEINSDSLKKTISILMYIYISVTVYKIYSNNVALGKKHAIIACD